MGGASKSSGAMKRRGERPEAADEHASAASPDLDTDRLSPEEWEAAVQLIRERMAFDGSVHDEPIRTNTAEVRKALGLLSVRLPNLAEDAYGALTKTFGEAVGHPAIAAGNDGKERDAEVSVAERTITVEAVVTELVELLSLGELDYHTLNNIWALYLNWFGGKIEYRNYHASEDVKTMVEVFRAVLALKVDEELRVRLRQDLASAMIELEEFTGEFADEPVTDEVREQEPEPEQEEDSPPLPPAFDREIPPFFSRLQLAPLLAQEPKGRTEEMESKLAPRFRSYEADIAQGQYDRKYALANLPSPRSGEGRHVFNALQAVVDVNPLFLLNTRAWLLSKSVKVPPSMNMRGLLLDQNLGPLFESAREDMERLDGYPVLRQLVEVLKMPATPEGLALKDVLCWRSLEVSEPFSVLHHLYNRRKLSFADEEATTADHLLYLILKLKTILNTGNHQNIQEVVAELLPDMPNDMVFRGDEGETLLSERFMAVNGRFEEALTDPEDSDELQLGQIFFDLLSTQPEADWAANSEHFELLKGIARNLDFAEQEVVKLEEGFISRYEDRWKLLDKKAADFRASALELEGADPVLAGRLAALLEGYRRHQRDARLPLFRLLTGMMPELRGEMSRARHLGDVSDQSLWLPLRLQEEFLVVPCLIGNQLCVTLLPGE